MSDPIEVKSNPTASLTWQTLRVTLVFLCGVVLNHFIESEAVIVAGLAAITALLTYGYGVLSYLRQHKKLKLLAGLVPDSEAVVK